MASRAMVFGAGATDGTALAPKSDQPAARANPMPRVVKHRDANGRRTRDGSIEEAGGVGEADADVEAAR